MNENLLCGDCAYGNSPVTGYAPYPIRPERIILTGDTPACVPGSVKPETPPMSDVDKCIMLVGIRGKLGSAHEALVSHDRDEYPKWLKQASDELDYLMELEG